MKENIKIFSSSSTKENAIKKKMMKKKIHPFGIKIYNSTTSGGCGCGKKGF
ncbi:hypothetical protein [Aeribacillus composti]|uniref:hypothetical protein n=1 Tax=Aeribacillus composti TaxID=1868734 RepID=UPI002E20DEB6|nr:hypothetical protein [Aeribacillus composti]MED1442767.1 hypothetical protein [Aeribacillus composti]